MIVKSSKCLHSRGSVDPRFIRLVDFSVFSKSGGCRQILMEDPYQWGEVHPFPRSLSPLATRASEAEVAAFPDHSVSPLTKARGKWLWLRLASVGWGGLSFFHLCHFCHFFHFFHFLDSFILSFFHPFIVSFFHSFILAFLLSPSSELAKVHAVLCLAIFWLDFWGHVGLLVR